MSIDRADTIDRHGMWQMLIVYGLNWEEIVEALQSFYVDSRACVLVGMDVSEWFLVNVGLRHGCVMSSWLLQGAPAMKAGTGECKGWQVCDEPAVICR